MYELTLEDEIIKDLAGVMNDEDRVYLFCSVLDELIQDFLTTELSPWEF